ncbi:MAG: SNF2-related protein [Bdellovibrionales bacterium]
MAKLAYKVQFLFDSQSRTRGREYFLHNAVTFKRLEAGCASFTVRGNYDYDVDIEYDGDTPSFECSCPYFMDGNNCKHIWAAILDIDNKGLLKKITGDVASENKSPDLHWRKRLESAKNEIEGFHHDRQKESLAQQNTHSRVGTYAINLRRTIDQNRIQLELLMQERLKKGGLGKTKPAELTSEKIVLYEDPVERDFLWDLVGRTEAVERFYSYYTQKKVDSVFLTPGHADMILRKISDNGKLFFRSSDMYEDFREVENEIRRYTYSQDLWSFRLSLVKTDKGYQLSGHVYNENGDTREFGNIIGYIEHFIFFDDFCARSNASEHALWLEFLAKGPTLITEEEIDSFLEYVWRDTSTYTPIQLPLEMKFKDIEFAAPLVRLSLDIDKNSGLFAAKLGFVYGSNVVSPGTGFYIYHFSAKERILRNTELEKTCYEKLMQLRPISSEDPSVQGYFLQEHLVGAIEKFFSYGWEVIARDHKVVIGNNLKFNLTSDMDWFDLEAEFQFGSQKLGLPQLLHALRTKQRMVTLGDGSTGVLPEAWLNKLAPLLSIGKTTSAGMRLSKVQTLFLSASISESAFALGKEFNTLLELLNKVKSLKPVTPDKLVKGKLRPYQKEGLGWLKLLSENNIGGILADDMGLGKTIQILALLSKTKSQQPSLIVVPRSVVYNWEKECSKFTPHLKTLIYSGTNRKQLQKSINDHDLILTTYQTLRNDIENIKDVAFDYLIMDEAHYAKNSQAQITMALKLVNARRKIALTGTPVENSLMDLFTILSIVNPGLVTEAQAHRWSKEMEPQKIQSLGRALSPFLLRRTKEQVLKELPEKTEQVLMCELSPTERKKYDELKTFYWGQLTKTFENKGFSRSKIDILEALLRLRQASCHQGLIDPKLAHSSSAKFDLVLDQLQTIIKDGHKALVFSQFTSLLELFSHNLRAQGIIYEYLDGKTKDRAARVDHFQTRKDCSVFLLSLKAGGVGLNLTAADYVYILDPWWNPAAESQAIDRTHRIGQKKKVFAYKVIAKNTIEEKILELQLKKKKLASAVVSNDPNLLKSLQIKDLAALFE